MKSDFHYTDFPASYLRCFNKQCERRDTCLRYQLALRMPKEYVGVFAISPFYLENLDDGECPHFQLDQPQPFALGITHLFDDIPLKKAEAIKSQMISYFGSSTYYRWKQKRRLVKPKEQAYIKNLFLAQGITDDPLYDDYQEYYDLG